MTNHSDFLISYFLLIIIPKKFNNDFWNRIKRALNGKEKAEFEKLKRMAEIGNPYTQSAVGMMYAIGHGVAKDPVIGHAWYNIAITNGHEESKEHIKDIKLNPKQLIEAQVMYDEIYKRIEAKEKAPTDPDRIYKPRNP